jgi:hypothetical protein
MYFSKFPLLSYPTAIKDNRAYVVARNIIRRVALSEQTKNAAGVYIEYNVKDGEKPEHIADRIYGNPDDHWIVLLANEIINPHQDWYMSSSVFEEYVRKKYNGFALIGQVNTVKSNFDDVAAGDTVYTHSLNSTSYNNVRKSSKIISVNSLMSYIVVDNDNLKNSVNSLNPEIRRNIVQTNLGYRIYRFLPYLNAVHHFEVSLESISNTSYPNKTVVVDPLAEWSSSPSYSSPPSGFYAPKTGIHQDGESPSSVGAFANTFIGKYMDILGQGTSYNDTYAVSNYTYEYTLNESRRKIRVLHPRYLDTVKREFDALMRI